MQNLPSSEAGRQSPKWALWEGQRQPSRSLEDRCRRGMDEIWFLAGSGSRIIISGAGWSILPLPWGPTFPSVFASWTTSYLWGRPAPANVRVCIFHPSASFLCQPHAHPLPRAAANCVGFLHPVWDEPPVLSEVSAGFGWGSEQAGSRGNLKVICFHYLFQSFLPWPFHAQYILSFLVFKNRLVLFFMNFMDSSPVFTDSWVLGVFTMIPCAWSSFQCTCQSIYRGEKVHSPKTHPPKATLEYCHLHRIFPDVRLCRCLHICADIFICLFTYRKWDLLMTERQRERNKGKERLEAEWGRGIQGGYISSSTPWNLSKFNL